MGSITSKIWGSNADESDGILSRNPDHIRFLLYTNPSDSSRFEEIFLNDLESLKASSFDASKNVKVLIHGFISTAFDEYPQNVKNAYLTNKDNSKNVIVVDWSKLGLPEAGAWNYLLYPAVIANVSTVGERVGNFILWLRDAMELNLDNVHVVGHSLGSHVAGWAGHTVNAAGKQLARISALDPAGPLFYFDVVTRRLNKDDAEFVDAYHTNALLKGTMLSVGDVDFFVNGGFVQPDCPRDFSGTCSHARIHQIFSQTILDGPKNANRNLNHTGSRTKLDNLVGSCDKNLIFGEYCPPSVRGKFYVDQDYNAQG